VLVRFGTLTGVCWLESGVSVFGERIFFFFLPVRLSLMIQLLIEYNRFFWGCLGFCLMSRDTGILLKTMKIQQASSNLEVQKATMNDPFSMSKAYSGNPEKRINYEEDRY
jgi:hypothetical protein